jgi:hypothetical protein
VTKYVGMGSGPMMMPGEKPGGFQRTVHALLSVLKFFGVDMLEQNEWERDSLLMGKNGAADLTWVLTRPVRPTRTPFVGAYVRKDQRGPINCSIYDHGDFCLYCVASREWTGLRRMSVPVGTRERVVDDRQMWSAAQQQHAADGASRRRLALERLTEGQGSRKPISTSSSLGVALSYVGGRALTTGVRERAAVVASRVLATGRAASPSRAG